MEIGRFVKQGIFRDMAGLWTNNVYLMNKFNSHILNDKQIHIYVNFGTVLCYAANWRPAYSENTTTS